MKKKITVGLQLATNYGLGEKFEKPIKMVTNLLSLLEMKFLYSPSKYGDGSLFSHIAKIVLN
jgi:hypothetical protein